MNSPILTSTVYHITSPVLHSVSNLRTFLIRLVWCCHMHILVCLYNMSVQIEWPAGPSLLAALPALNSSLAIGHNPVAHSLLCQITRMASLHKKEKKVGSLKLQPFNHLPPVSSQACHVSDCLPGRT